MTERKWNEARAHRLLRPLASKVAAFRRQQDEIQRRRISANCEEWLQCNIGAFQAPSGRDDFVLPTPACARQYYDRRTNHKTTTRYRSSRAAAAAASKVTIKCEKDSCRQSGLTVSSPSSPEHVAQAHFPSSPHWLNTESDGWNLQRKHKELRKQPDSLVKSIENVLDATCRTQACGPPQPRIGARSLSAMCLRYVPEGMLDEQRYRLQLNPDDRSDVLAETYSELDTFDSLTANQNSAVRRVTRAHAIQLYSTLFNDGALGHHAFLDLCTQDLVEKLQPEELETILLSWMRSFLSLRTCRLVNVSSFGGDLPIPFVVLMLFQRMLKTRQPTFTYRVVRKLILSKALKVEELGHPSMQAIWRGALRSISMQCAESTAAFDLLRTVLVAACGVNPEASLQNALAQSGQPTASFLDITLDWTNIDFEDANEERFSSLTDTVKRICLLLLRIGNKRARNCLSASSSECGPIQLPSRVLRDAAVSIALAYTQPSFSRMARKTGFPLIASIVLLADLQAAPIERDEFGSRTGLQSLKSKFLAFHKVKRMAGSYVFTDSEVDQVIKECLYSVTTTSNNLSPKMSYAYLEQANGQRTGSYQSQSSVLEAALRCIQEILEPNTLQREKPLVTKEKLQTIGRIDQPKTSHGFWWEEGLDEWVKMSPTPSVALRFARHDTSAVANASDPKWHRPIYEQCSPVRKLNEYVRFPAPGIDTPTSGQHRNHLKRRTPSSTSSDEGESADELAQQESPSMFRAKARCVGAHVLPVQRKRPRQA